MANESYAVRLELPWKEPLGLKEPTDAQWAGGVVVVMRQTISGLKHSMKRGEHFLMDAASGNRLVERGTCRFETEREERIAKAEGHKRPTKGVKRPAKASKAKAEKAAPEANASEEADGGEG